MATRYHRGDGDIPRLSPGIPGNIPARPGNNQLVHRVEALFLRCDVMDASESQWRAIWVCQHCPEMPRTSGCRLRCRVPSWSATQINACVRLRALRVLRGEMSSRLDHAGTTRIKGVWRRNDAQDSGCATYKDRSPGSKICRTTVRSIDLGRRRMVVVPVSVIQENDEPCVGPERRRCLHLWSVVGRRPVNTNVLASGDFEDSCRAPIGLHDRCRGGARLHRNSQR